VLLDTGEGKESWIAALRETLSHENATIEHALISHWHHDHTGGIDQLRQYYPGIKVYKNQPQNDQLSIDDGQSFVVDGATLRAVYSPGHTEDHMAMILEEEDAMFTADNVLGHGTAVFEDLSKYLASLEKMRHLFSGRAYPGHGQVIDDGKSKILEYIRHRQQREDQVLQVLMSSKSSTGEANAESNDTWASMDMVRIIYKDVPESLHIPANGGVVQVLRKLEKDGKVVETPTGEWRIKSRATL
jgi:ribonuclease/clavin/mitogillin